MQKVDPKEWEGYKDVGLIQPLPLATLGQSVLFPEPRFLFSHGQAWLLACQGRSWHTSGGERPHLHLHLLPLASRGQLLSTHQLCVFSQSPPVGKEDTGQLCPWAWRFTSCAGFPIGKTGAMLIPIS